MTTPGLKRLKTLVEQKEATTSRELHTQSPTNYYATAGVVDVLGTGSVFSSTVIVRPTGLTTTTADSLANSGVVLSNGMLWSAVAAVGGQEDEWPLFFVFSTDAGLQILTPTPANPNPAGLLGRVLVMSARVDLGANLAELWCNGGKVGELTTTGTTFVAGTTQLFLGRDSDPPPPDTAPNPIVRDAVLGFASTRRYLGLEEISENAEANLRAMDMTAENLTGGDWEYRYSVKQSLPEGGAAPDLIRNLGSVGSSADLVRNGAPPIRDVPAYPGTFASLS